MVNMKQELIQDVFIFFNLATHGKCIYFPSYGVWLTPIEFQEISGSTQADWKRGIHFTSVRFLFNSFKMSSFELNFRLIRM